MRGLGAFLLIAAAGCNSPTRAEETSLAVFRLGASTKPKPAGSTCGFCADVGGKNDLKKLCSLSSAAWDAMAACICQKRCALECGSDWCAQLGSANYKNASDACNACATAPNGDGGPGSGCIDEVLACADAQ